MNRTFIWMGCFIDTKQKKLLDISVSLAQLLLPNGKRLGRPPAESSSFSFKYFIRNEKGIDTHVCQKAFCIVHGFTQKRLQVLCQKITDGNPFDRRGKHQNREKVSDSLLTLVREHISSLPARTSHYSRKENAGRKYLPPELSIARLHDPEFLEFQERNFQRKIAHQILENIRKPIVTEHFYHNVFVKEFKIGFWYPRTDTCSSCDFLKHSIETASDDNEKARLEKDLKQHHILAQSGYDAFRSDQEKCKLSWKRETQSANSTIAD